MDKKMNPYVGIPHTGSAYIEGNATKTSVKSGKVLHGSDLRKGDRKGKK